MSDFTEKSDTTPSQLKKKIMSSWDQMKSRYPVIRSMDLVKGDTTKEEFLRYIDGLKNTDDIRAYFTLDPSEAHLIFSDLLNLGAIRFLEDAERLGYLKKHNLEIKQKLDFLMAERNKLAGEEFYLSKRTQEKKQAIEELRERLPALHKTLDEHSRRLSGLMQEHNDLWESNSELIGLAKDMKSKERQVKQALDRLEYEFPKLLKKKTKIIGKLKKTEEKNFQNASRNDRLNKRLLVYQDTIDEMCDYLEDAKTRVDDLMQEE